MEVVVSASQGVMGSLLGKLGDLLAKEYKLQKGVKGDITSLKEELGSMHAFLQHVDQLEDPDVQLKQWMEEVRELSYDIEDCIDHFMHHLGREPNELGCIQGCFKINGKLKKLRTRHEIAHKIKQLKAAVVEASQRRKRYKLEPPTQEAISSSSNVAIDPRVLALFAEAADLVGIDRPRDELVKWLTEGESRSAQQLKVVSVVGLGGLGKTALANQVYLKIKGQFQCCAFVLVSQKPDLKKIFKNILSQVISQEQQKKQEYADMKEWDEVRLITELREFLRDKRYFIIIDDIWSTRDWRTIKCALIENDCGSRIMTTTRISDVAKSCCSPRDDRVCEMKPLSIVDSRKLFFKRIFRSEDSCPTQLKEVSDEILKKCGGLPLAIITIASLLASKSITKEQWESVRNSIGSGLERNRNVEEMKRILSLSYNDLPHYLKTCLLYLSIFPEDYMIDKHRLIRRWMAEGFINMEGRQTLEEVGECYFNELINRSMIQPVGIGYGGARACQVHDMILDLIISKSVEENFITLFGDQKHTLVPQGKVRRLSLDYRDREHPMVPSTMILSHVRSLTIFGFAERMPPLLDFRFLRVLDLEGSEKLKNHYLKIIGRLFQLKYLGLRETDISELPDQIGELQCLETLDLRSTYVKKVPASIIRLRKLVRLLANPIGLPDWIGNMQVLQELPFISLSSCSINSVQELGKLTKLRTLGVICDFHDRHSDFGTYRENLVSSLNKLGGLRSLSVYSGAEYFPLDSWSPPPYLQKFEMNTNYCFPGIPEWIASLGNLTYLDININQVGEEDFQVLGDLPALLLLILCSKPAPKERLTISSKGFRCLKEFHFYCWTCGMGLMFGAGAMPKLELLLLNFEACETKSLYGGGFDFGIQHLSYCLKQVYVSIDCSGAKDWEVDAAEAAIRNAANIHPNHPTLDIERWFESEMIREDGEREGLEEV